jgi:soluble lytic murein transglycosylase-like protein
LLHPDRALLLPRPILIASAMLALAAVSGCVATDGAFSPTASYSSDLSTSGDFAAALPDTVAVLPMPSGRVETEVAYAEPGDFAASSFAGPEPSSAVAAEPVALMPRIRPLAVVNGGSEDVSRLIEKYATLYEVPVQLVRRIAKRESNFYPGAYSRGHWGLMQIKHATARGMGYDGPARGLLDAETNLKFAVKYLRGAWMVANGNPDLADRLYQRGYYYDAKRKGMLDETGLGRDRVRRRRA